MEDMEDQAQEFFLSNIDLLARTNFATPRKGKLVADHGVFAAHFSLESRRGSDKCEFLRLESSRAPHDVAPSMLIMIILKLSDDSKVAVFKTSGSKILWLNGYSVTPVNSEIQEISICFCLVKRGSIHYLNQKLYEDSLAGLRGCDVVLCVEDTELCAHRLVLASQSEVFDRMFSGPFKEADDGRVEIKDVSREALEKLLEYLYTGQIQVWDRLEAELIKLSDMYMVDGLKASLPFRMLTMSGEDALCLLSKLQDSPLDAGDLVERALFMNLSNHFCGLNVEQTLNVLMRICISDIISSDLRCILIANCKSFGVFKLVSSPAWADFASNQPLLSDAIKTLCD